MYQRATKTKKFTQRTSSLVCGRVFSGNIRQVTKLIELHAKVCKECRDDFNSAVTMRYVEQGENQYVDPTYLHRAGEFHSTFGDTIDSANLSDEDRIFYRQLAEYLTTDLTLNSTFYSTPEKTLARRIEQAGVFYKSIAFTEKECLEYKEEILSVQTDTHQERVFINRLSNDCSYDMLLNPQMWRGGGETKRKRQLMDRITRDMAYTKWQRLQFK
jgi:hypothetical protein